MSAIDKTSVEESVIAGLRQYIQNRRMVIDEFIDQNYSFSGAWQLNRKAFGWDIAKAPLNVAWAPIYLLNQLGRVSSKKLGWHKTSDFFASVPPGMRTRVESEVEWLVYTKFLCLPIEQNYKHAPPRTSNTNLLMEFILNQPEINQQLQSKLSVINELAFDTEKRAKVEDKLTHYVDSRKAAAEITTALIAASASLVSQKTLSIGALGIGQSAATAIAYHSAVNSFAFGSSLGSTYYGVFPAAASTGLLVTVTGGVAAALGVVAAFGGVIADPVQRKLGLHHRKLDKLLSSIEQQFIGDDNAYALKDQYVARVLDLIDLLSLVTTKI